MADKSPRKRSGKKPSRTLKEKRADKKLKRRTGSSFPEPQDRRR
jgi:hypothetical protein